jgi:hypothetical protein
MNKNERKNNIMVHKILTTKQQGCLTSQFHRDFAALNPVNMGR